MNWEEALLLPDKCAAKQTDTTEQKQGRMKYRLMKRLQLLWGWPYFHHLHGLLRCLYCLLLEHRLEYLPHLYRMPLRCLLEVEF